MLNPTQNVFRLQQILHKIVITGPESTGKSTVTLALAKHFNTLFVPEFARNYLNKINRAYTYDDLLVIAKGQIALEEELAQKAQNQILICDTDLLVIMVWSEHKFGKCHPWILEQLATRKYSHYFLTNIDFPWSEDPLREHPEPEMRTYFFNLYHALLKQMNLPFTILSGDENTRLTTAINIIETMKVKTKLQ